MRGARASLEVGAKASGGLFGRFCFANSTLNSPTPGDVLGKAAVEEDGESMLLKTDESPSHAGMQ